MHLEIITPEKVMFTDEVDEFLLQTPKGQLAILPHHVNLMTEVLPGELIIKMKGKQQSLGATGGFLQITDGNCVILSDYAVRVEEIEVEKALAAQKKAEEIIKKKEDGVSERDYALAQADMRRAIMELEIGNKYRKRRTTPIS
jgi:F-type H+-transporting ATPase subunit epsilon